MKLSFEANTTKKCEENGTQSEGRDSHAGSEVDDEQSGIKRSFKT